MTRAVKCSVHRKHEQFEGLHHIRITQYIRRRICVTPRLQPRRVHSQAAKFHAIILERSKQCQRRVVAESDKSPSERLSLRREYVSKRRAAMVVVRRVQDQRLPWVRHADIAVGVLHSSCSDAQPGRGSAPLSVRTHARHPATPRVELSEPGESEVALSPTAPSLSHAPRLRPASTDAVGEDAVGACSLLRPPLRPRSCDKRPVCQCRTRAPASFRWPFVHTPDAHATNCKSSRSGPISKG